MTNKQDLPDTGKELQVSPIETDLESRQDGADENVGVEQEQAEQNTPTVETGAEETVQPEETEAKPKRKRKKKSNDESVKSPEKQPEEKPQKQQKQQKVKEQNIITIEDERTVQTERDMAFADLRELQEAARTGRIMTGIIQGFERTDKDFSGSRVVVYHGSCKILISSMKLVEEPEDFHGKEKAEVYAAMAQKRIGAEIEFVVKTVDEKEFTAVANRVEAMSIRKDNFYLKKSGIIKEGACAEARIVAVTPFGVWAEIFGVESFINNRELGYQRIHQPSEFFQTGQRVIVKILSVKKDNGKIRVDASIKQAQENPFEKEIWKFAQGSMYLGKVTMVTERGVFVALDGGVECYCKMPARGRPPRGARATVKIVNIDPVKSRVIGFITHISAKL